MTERSGDALRTSALLPFLPLLYVAWSDGNMELEELRAICSRVLDVWKMTPEDRERVVRWLDPDQPPSRRELDEMLARVRDASVGLSGQDRRSLTELGLALARAGGGGVSAEERAALEEIERALGARGAQAAQVLLEAAAAEPDR